LQGALLALLLLLSVAHRLATLQQLLLLLGRRGGRGVALLAL
jgi:hypothetical protein